MNKNNNSLCILALAIFFMLTTVQWAGISAEENSVENQKSRNYYDTSYKTYDISTTANVGNEYDDGDGDGDVNWDVIIFTQQWPVTLCYHWREEDKNHKCVLPTTKEFWTIHGIWPTKLGQFGPSFCNKSADFDVKQLTEIEKRLEEYWPDIEGATDDNNWLWKHEWLKHGTCAALLETLDNERKYFAQGLTWRDNYNISYIFDKSEIVPDAIYTVINLQNALIKSLGKNPSIHCLYDHKKDVNYLSEIRLCFDKELQLIDCNGVNLGDAVIVDYPGGNVITNCHISKPVQYPSNVPPLLHRRRTHYNHNNNSWHQSLVNLYKLLQFIMWSTL